MKNDKDRYWDCLDQAMEASHSGRIEEALAWLDEALLAHPGGAEAHNGRGEIQWDEGRVDEALFEFESAIRTDPKFTAAHLNRVEMLIEEVGETGIEVLRAVKRALDPDWLLNPGALLSEPEDAKR